MNEKLALAVQFCIATGIGCLFYWWLDDGIQTPKVLALGALFVGFWGLWGTMFLWTWIRNGWQSARSMSMNP